MSTPRLPARARVVVIGGGVIGSSVAYHLAHAGWTDTLLLERDRLTSGTTWHAAGLMVTFGSTSETSTRMRQYTRDLYSRLEAETGQSTGFKPVGFVEVATEPGRLEEYRRVSAFNRYLGVDVQEISAKEVEGLFPVARTDDVLAGFYVADDGRANPVDVTMALAKGARMQGATIVESCPVTEVLTRGGAVVGVRTPYGDVECEYVVNCTGMWARQLGEEHGVVLANQAAEHYYLITDDLPGLSPDAPVLEDPASYGYFREETGGLMVGLFEGVAAPWKVDGIPSDASFLTLPPDWDRMGPFLEKAMARVPASFDVGVRTFFCGPESFTPDLAPMVGEAPEVRNYFVAAGLNSIGILTGGGIGRVMAHWVMTGRPDVDVTAMGVDRLQAFQTNPEYRAARTTESLGLVYACHFPDRSPTTARGAKRSPWHDRLAAAGAYFRDVSGWESPGWYAPAGNAFGVEPVAHELTWGRSPWWACWEAEHRAVREGVGVMDMSFMAKFRVQGRDAGRFLDHVSANAVDGAAGTITYTQWLGEGGTLEADLTVTKLADDDFLVVASDTAHRHVETHLRRRLATGPFADAHAFVTDVTSGLAQLNVQGPRSRELLQSLTSADLSNEAFGFRHAAWIDLGLARVLLVRITYLGELGYELYVPAEQAVHVYDRVMAAGHGAVPVGLKALSSLRLEKAYRDYGHDIDNTDTVWEAGLGFAVALDKPGGFVGRDAATAQKAADGGRPPRRRLAQVLLREPDAYLVHAEVVRRDGVPVGYLRAGSYGWTLGGAVGLAMLEPGTDLLPDGEALTPAWIEAGDWTVEVADRHVPATVSLRPLYDPANARIKA